METRSTRKPYSEILGYVASRRCQAACGGWIVIYDRKAGFDCDADERWIVMHEPSSLHVAVRSREDAYEAMRQAAAGTLAEILPEPDPDAPPEETLAGAIAETIEQRILDILMLLDIGMPRAAAVESIKNQSTLGPEAWAKVLDGLQKKRSTYQMCETCRYLRGGECKDPHEGWRKAKTHGTNAVTCENWEEQR